MQNDIWNELADLEEELTGLSDIELLERACCFYALDPDDYDGRAELIGAIVATEYRNSEK